MGRHLGAVTQLTQVGASRHGVLQHSDRGGIGAAVMNEKIESKVGQQPADPLLTVTLRDVAFVLVKRWVSIVVLLATTAIAALGYLLVVKDDLYTSEAKVLIRRGQEQAPLPTVIADRAVMFSNPMADVRSEVDIIRSAETLTQLVDQLKLDQIPPEPRPTGFFKLVRYQIKESVRTLRDLLDDVYVMAGLQQRMSKRERILLGLSRAFRVEAEPESNIVSVRLTWQYREGSGAVVNTLVDLYLTHRLALFQGASAAAFFGKRRDEIEGRLLQAERELNDYESRTGIREVDRQIADLLDRYSAAREEAGRARIAVDEMRVKISRLSTIDETLDQRIAAIGEFPPHTLASQLLQELSTRMAAQAGSAVLMSGSGPAVQRTSREIERLHLLLREHLIAVADEREAAYKSKQAHAERLGGELDTLHRNAARWRELRRETGSASEAFKFNDRRFDEASAIAALEQAKLGNVVVIQRAEDPLGTTGIAKTTMFWLALAFGLLLGIAWAALRELVDQTVWRETELRRLVGLPVLAVVPKDRRLTVSAP